MGGLDINVLVTLLFGASAGGATAGIISVIKTLRGGKIEREETLITRLDADNQKQQRRAEEAERRAEKAEIEAEEYRKQRNEAREQLARLRWHVIENYGSQLPEPGDDNE